MLAPVHDIFFALPFGYVFFSFFALLMLPCPFLISSGRQEIRMSRFVLYCIALFRFAIWMSKTKS